VKGGGQTGPTAFYLPEKGCHLGSETLLCASSYLFRDRSHARDGLEWRIAKSTKRPDCAPDGGNRQALRLGRGGFRRVGLIEQLDERHRRSIAGAKPFFENAQIAPRTVLVARAELRKELTDRSIIPEPRER